MKLLFAVLAIATVGTLATGIKLDDIKSPNLSVEYELKVFGEKVPRIGSLQLKSPPKYAESSTDPSRITILFDSTILLNAIGIKQDESLEEGSAIGLKLPVERADDMDKYTILNKKIRFELHTHLLKIPEVQQLKVGDIVTLWTQYAGTYVDGVVVLVDTYQWVELCNADSEKICDNPNVELHGPFVALSIEVEA